MALPVMSREVQAAAARDCVRRAAESRGDAKRHARWMRAAADHRRLAASCLRAADVFAVHASLRAQMGGARRPA